jgi:hypothetical protein
MLQPSEDVPVLTVYHVGHLDQIYEPKFFQSIYNPSLWKTQYQE